MVRTSPICCPVFLKKVAVTNHKTCVYTEIMRSHPSKRASPSPLFSGQSQENGWEYTPSDDDDSGKLHEYPYIVEHIVESILVDTPIVSTRSVSQFVISSTIF